MQKKQDPDKGLDFNGRITLAPADIVSALIKFFSYSFLFSTDDLTVCCVR